MLKRLIITGVAVAGVGALVFGRDLTSYVGTSLGWMKDSVKQSVPVEFELERARRMLTELTPDIEQNMRLIAKEEIELERLEKQIAQGQEKLGKQKADIVRLKDELSNDEQVYFFAGRSYSANQVKTDLANRFKRFKVSEQTVASQQQMLNAREKSVAAAREKLEGMLAARRQLQVDLEHLEARRKMIAAAQTTSDYNFDDSRLARLKDVMAELETRLDVAERMVGADQYFADEIPIDEPAQDNIVDQVTEYFGEDTAEVNAFAGAE